MKKTRHHGSSGPSEAQSEKRIFKRRQMIYYLEVLDRDTDRLIGHIVDITPEGMMVMSESPFEIQKTFAFKIPYKKPSGPKQFLQLTAKSRWCTREMHANFYDTGFEMLRLEPAAAEALEYIIESMCF